MADHSKIEWTEATWNPVTGCTKISDGCANCYAERLAKRLRAMGNAKYSDGFKVTLHPGSLETPLAWRQPRMVFVNSMGDLFHHEVPLDLIQGVFNTIKKSPQHTYQILTKRASRLAQLAPILQWPDNLWMGVTVENGKYLDRVNDLATVPAKVRFISCEPLLGPLKGLNLNAIDWVIAGGESGPGARPLNPDWVRALRNICMEQSVPFFFKQWGGVNKKKTGRILDGVEWAEYPKAVNDD
ncbi:hypothetical protein DESUT3_13660 [Desulfuromonas versatilis]|uniref:Phage Gp37/Gp68 family protein n=1 Tax=Desulfuromonas versatilis TaxID=2802975 RepID=A0ABM8HQX6_9BACT|nr:phage Gp37/Gp68 family protein [Desulfuromonas versatilis]BCR04297.1 hypothetical protein DESUT3_13660 [Desulfuromonas versatilis]